MVEVAFWKVVAPAKRLVPVKTCEPFKSATFVESALSEMEFDGSEMAPAEMVRPAEPEMRPEKRPATAMRSPPVMVRPCVDARPAALIPPEKVEVALAVEVIAPPVRARPPAAEMERPPANVFVADEVWMMLPPVIVRPLVVERPPAFVEAIPPAKVEVALLPTMVVEAVVPT